MSEGRVARVRKRALEDATRVPESEGRVARVRECALEDVARVPMSGRGFARVRDCALEGAARAPAALARRRDVRVRALGVFEPRAMDLTRVRRLSDRLLRRALREHAEGGDFAGAGKLELFAGNAFELLEMLEDGGLQACGGSDGVPMGAS